ncbi:indole-3-glycerol-phosphate synthase TrpC, partial [Staphylococcus warneri]
MTILDEIVLYKKELLSSHYYHEKLKTINKDTQCNQPSQKNTLK